MAVIETLVADIEEVLTHPHIVDKVVLERFGQSITRVTDRQLLSEERTELSMSMLGTRCDRQLQYKASPYHRIKGEPLSADAKLKFMFGDLIEALILLLAREAGHKVEGEQDELNINGVLGHRDSIIDGVLVDCKSASSFSFQKFKHGLREDEDSFGYLTQLHSYLYASVGGAVFCEPGRAAFLVVDKQFGHICLDIHSFDSKSYGNLVDEKKALVSNPNLAPRGFRDELDGKSGNKKLGVACSYCAFKSHCWSGLQTFLYSNGPRYLTHVERTPDVPRVGDSN